jgi:SAM-dependent methyltransferase
VTDDALRALIRLHEDTPRQGPGDPAALDRLIATLGLPPAPRAADFGCGAGATALRLAATLGADVLALDFAPTFLAALGARLAADPPARGRVRPALGDMRAPPVGPGALDLIVSEGAAYAVGFAAALAAWAPLLRPGGGMVVSECVWWGAARPAAAAAFWAEGYPAMDTPAAALAAAERAGLRLVAAERLAPAAWRESYYAPLAARCDALAAEAAADPPLAAAIAEARAEMALFATPADAYGYLLLALDRPPA